MTSLSRRNLLLSGAAAALVPGDIRSAFGATPAPGAPPKRVLLLFTPNGYGVGWEDFAAPNSSQPLGFSLGQTFAPLSPYQANMLILDGIDMASTAGSSGGNHEKGAGNVWTGSPLSENADKNYAWSTGMSVDQHIAKAVGAATRFRSLELSVDSSVNGNTFSRTCYSEPGHPVDPEASPFKAFSRIFQGVTAAGAPAMPVAADPRLKQKKSVLDYVRTELNTLSGNLGSIDRARLAAHLDALRELEKTLTASPSAVVGATCAPPTLGPEIDPHANNNYPALGKLQTDLAVMAFACDLTRVINFQWSGAHAGTVMGWVDKAITADHHSISHFNDGADYQRQYREICLWYAKQVAYLIGQLQSIPEGGGTMLDNTLVVWGNELQEGCYHKQDRVPFTLFGGKNMGVRTGRYLKFNQLPHNNLLVSLCNAMGLADTTFGDGRYCTGPLSGLMM